MVHVYFLWANTLADPGFGQGGPRNFFPNVCRRSEAELGERSEPILARVGPQVLAFLVGLSLHLNHLIQSRVGISYRLFGTLPIGLLLSNWTQDSLIHLLWHLMTNFEICQLLATPGPFEYFWQNHRSSDNQSFLDEGATRLWQGLGVLGGQVPRLYGGTSFGGCNTLRGVRQGIENESSVFWHICDTLEGTRHWLIWSRISL